MATSMRDLLDAAQRQTLPHDPNRTFAPGGVTQVSAEDAIAAVTTTARALGQLTAEPATRRTPTLDAERTDLITHLTAATQPVAQVWPAHPAATASATGVSVADLVAAAADVAARLTPTLGDAQRWAIAVAFAETIRRCAHAAQSYPPYRTVPQLRRVELAAAALEQHATLRPPTPLGSAILDRAVPLPHPPVATLGITAAPDAIAGLLHQLRAAVAQHRLTLGDAFAATLVARSAAGHAATLATALTRATAAPPPWRASPAAWQAVQYAYAPFDDGTKNTVTTPEVEPPSDTVPVDDSVVGPSATLAWAITLHDALRAPPATRSAGSYATNAGVPYWPSQLDELAQTVTALRVVSNGLPELALLLRRATDDWHTHRTLYAAERRLTSYEDRNHAVTSTTRIVHPELGDLEELRAALHLAESLSLSLSVQLDRTRPDLGSKPQPALATMHAQALDPATLPAAARSALRRAGADTPPQWHARRHTPPPPRTGRSPAR